MLFYEVLKSLILEVDVYKNVLLLGQEMLKRMCLLRNFLWNILNIVYLNIRTFKPFISIFKKKKNVFVEIS